MTIYSPQETFWTEAEARSMRLGLSADYHRDRQHFLSSLQREMLLQFGQRAITVSDLRNHVARLEAFDREYDRRLVAQYRPIPPSASFDAMAKSAIASTPADQLTETVDRFRSAGARIDDDFIAKVRNSVAPL